MSEIEAELEIGVVVRYSPVTHRGFMIKIDEHGRRTGEEIFFHHDNGQFVGINEAGDGLEFTGSHKKGNGTLTIQLECGFPENGRHLEDKKLAFMRAPGRKPGDKDRAEIWTSPRLYKAMIGMLEMSASSDNRQLAAS